MLFTFPLKFCLLTLAVPEIPACFNKNVLFWLIHGKLKTTSNQVKKQPWPVFPTAWFQDDPFWTVPSLSPSERRRIANQSVCSLEELLKLASITNSSVVFRLQRPPPDHPHHHSWINDTLTVVQQSGIPQRLVNGTKWGKPSLLSLHINHSWVFMFFWAQNVVNILEGVCLFLLWAGDVDYWWAKGWSEAASARPDPDITGEMQSSKSAAVWCQQDAAEIQPSQHKWSQVWPHYNVMKHQPCMWAYAAELSTTIPGFNSNSCMSTPGIHSSWLVWEQMLAVFFSFLWLQTVEFLLSCVYVSICCLVLVTQSLGCIHSSRFALFCVVKATLLVLENLKLWKSQHFSFTMSTALKLSAICVAVRSCVARNRGHLWGQFPNQQSIRLCCKENTTQTSKIFQITFQVCRNNRLVQFRCKFILVGIF